MPASCKPRELAHDAQVYRAYLRGGRAARQPGRHASGASCSDYELKRDYQRFLQEPQSGRRDSDGRPTGTPTEVRGMGARARAAGRRRTTCSSRTCGSSTSDRDGRREVEDVEVHDAALPRRARRRQRRARASRGTAPRGASASVARPSAGQRRCAARLRSAPRRGAPAMTFEERVAARGAPSGSRERQAGFLVTVMLHAGVCVAASTAPSRHRATARTPRDFFRTLAGARRMPRRTPCGPQRGAALSRAAQAALSRDRRTRQPSSEARRRCRGRSSG